MFKAVLEQWSDSDAALPEWLAAGAPMGLAVPISIGGHFPQRAAVPERRAADLEPLVGSDVNHASMRQTFGDDAVAAGVGLVQKAVDDGFGELFVDRAAAEAALGGTVFPAPLGTVSKAKPDGSWKHRLIQDLRANHVNSAVALPERLVLPRPLEHALDLAELSAGQGSGEGLSIGIVDFADAFMSVPLAAAERRFNCAEIPEGLRRGRRALHEVEPEVGQLVAWRVLK